MQVEDDFGPDAVDLHHDAAGSTSSDDEMVDSASTPVVPRQKRALVQPHRLESNTEVWCYAYAQAREGGALMGHTARLAYFLPEHWSPSYKFTVFEDSYVLQFVPPAAGEGGPSTALVQYHLARPVQTASHQCHLPEFELVWPVPLDVTLMDSVRSACDRCKPGAKRKSFGNESSMSMSSVHTKLRKLGLSEEEML